jgi:hypothetical protein
MKFTAKCKVMLSMVAMALTLLLSNSIVEAATISKKNDEQKSTTSIGSTISIYDCKNLKINGKKTSKLKKKVKTVQTENSPSSFSYRTGSYFDDSDAYSTYSEYNNVYNNVKYISYGSYQLKFLKAGTYKITYDQYSKQHLSMEYASYDTTTYESLYRLITDYDYEHPSTDYYTYQTYSPAGTYVGSYYKSITTGKIYASGDEGLVPAAIVKGADGVEYLKYNAANVVKTTYIETYKVMATTSPVSSVTLGKSKQVAKVTSNGYKTTSKYTTKKFLSGNSGKLTVKASSSNYKINNIIVETYDNTGNVKYISVKNKAKINYGLYKNTSSYQSQYSSYSYSNSSMYKPTIIHIGYTNKFTGAYSKYEVVTQKDSEGKDVQYIKSTYKYAGKDEKEQVETDTYFEGPCHTSYTFYKK